MGNKIIDFSNKRKVVSVEGIDKFVNKPQVSLKIKFDDDETLILDLELLGQITESVIKELEEMEKRMTKKMGISLLATLFALGGNKKEFEKMIKDILK